MEFLLHFRVFPADSQWSFFLFHAVIELEVHWAAKWILVYMHLDIEAFRWRSGRMRSVLRWSGRTKETFLDPCIFNDLNRFVGGLNVVFWIWMYFRIQDKVQILCCTWGTRTISSSGQLYTVENCLGQYWQCCTMALSLLYLFIYLFLPKTFIIILIIFLLFLHFFKVTCAT